jgi:hypothetical protein
LEDHGDVTILGCHVIDDLITDLDLTFGNILQTGETAQGVDLPQPDGPTKTRNSLSAISMLRSLTAVTSPKRLNT